MQDIQQCMLGSAYYPLPPLSTTPLSSRKYATCMKDTSHVRLDSHRGLGLSLMTIRDEHSHVTEHPRDGP